MWKIIEVSAAMNGSIIVTAGLLAYLTRSNPPVAEGIMLAGAVSAGCLVWDICDAVLQHLRIKNGESN